MSEQERLFYYYNQLNTLEQQLINYKTTGDMVQILITEAHKIQIQDAIKGLESQGFTPKI